MSSSGTRRPAASRAPGKLDDVSEQRIFHVTHTANLPAILRTGKLLADASDAWVSRPEVDVSSTENREFRRNTELAGQPGLSIAGYVPFYLSPNATVWSSIRSNDSDSRLDYDVTHSSPMDFVVLVSSVKKAFETRPDDGFETANVAVTDGDATSALTRFGSTREGAERLLRKIRADGETGSILDAELLVHESFPVDQVMLIGVPNDRARGVVKAILEESGHATKIVVHPPWFQRPEEG